MESATAAGPLGVSRAEAARRGAEVDRMLRQREESLSTLQGCSRSVKAPPSVPEMKETTAAGSGNAASAHCEGGDARDSSNENLTAPRLGKLEDRQASTEWLFCVVDTPCNT